LYFERLTILKGFPIRVIDPLKIFDYDVNTLYHFNANCDISI